MTRVGLLVSAVMYDRSQSTTGSPSAHNDPFADWDLRIHRRAQIEDQRARYRGFRDAQHFLDLATTSFGSWVEREYRAIFMGEMWRHQKAGGIE